jgi:hypothetical protein
VKAKLILIVGLAIIAGVAWTLFTRRAAETPHSIPASTLSVKPSTATEAPLPAGQRSLGAFSIGGRNFNVVIQVKTRAPGVTNESGAVAEFVEIRDSSGRAQYRRDFSYPSDTEVSAAWSVSAKQIKGAQGSGLLLSYDLDEEPSAPEPESTSWWQLFGIVDGSLKPFGPPISVEGDLLPPSESPSDTMEFKVWAHHFRIAFPVHIDWTHGAWSPAQQCEATCEYKVLPEDLAPREDLTFARLCSQSVQACDRPERVIVKKDSRIELLAAQLNVKWTGGGPTTGYASDLIHDAGAITAAEDVWLKVRIDGKEGWIHEDEDFTALGLPFEQ